MTYRYNDININIEVAGEGEPETTCRLTFSLSEKSVLT